MTTYTKKVVKNSVVILACSILAAFIAYLIRLLYAEKLTTEDFGLFYAVYAVIGFFVALRDFGFLESLAKFIPEYIVKKKPALIKSTIKLVNIAQMTLGGIITLTLILLSNYLSKSFFHSPKAYYLLLFLAIGFWLKGFVDLLRVAFQGFQRLTICSSIEIVLNVFILLSSIIFFSFGLGLMSPALAYAIFPIILIPIYYYIFIKKVFPQFRSIRSSITGMFAKRILKYASYVALGISGSMLLNYMDTLMLTYFSGLEQVALYNIAMPIAMMLSVVSLAVSGILFPVVVELWTKKNKLYLQLGLELLYKYLSILIIPAALLVFSFPEIFINILFGSKFVAAAIALRILSLGMIFLVLSNITKNTIAAIGRPDINTKIVFVVAVVNLLLNLLLIPRFGIGGAAVAISVSYALMLVLGYIELKRFIRVDIHITHWIKMLFIAVLMVVVMYVLKNLITLGVWPEAAIISTVLIILYLIMIFLTKLVRVGELQRLYQQIRAKD